MKTIQEIKDEAARQWNVHFDYRAIRNGVQVGNIKMLHLDTVIDKAIQMALDESRSTLEKIAEYGPVSRWSAYEDIDEIQKIAREALGK